MSTEVIGIVEEVMNNGKAKGSGLRVGGLKYGVFDPVDQGLDKVNEGDNVSFRFIEKDSGGKWPYKNIQGKITKVAGTVAATPTAEAPTGGKRWRNNGEEGGFPIHQRAYERALDRRNALNAAVDLANSGCLDDVMVKMKTDEIVAEVIRIAREFEDYTTGGEIAVAEMVMEFDEENFDEMLMK